MLDDIL